MKQSFFRTPIFTGFVIPVIIFVVGHLKGRDLDHMVVIAIVAGILGLAFNREYSRVFDWAANAMTGIHDEDTPDEDILGDE